MEHATLGGGCFWCLEAAYELVEGVTHVESGYTGGLQPNPTYEQVCTGTTGHAEVVRVDFDPTVITYREILEIFFAIHDPTTLNRQGHDVGSQYRSAIFFHSTEQGKTARALIEELNQADLWGTPIVTEVTALPEYYPAEEHHRSYYGRNPNQGYCQIVIAPKVAKLRKTFASKLRTNT